MEKVERVTSLPTFCRSEMYMNAHDTSVGLQNPQRLCLQEFEVEFFMKMHDVFFPELHR